MSKILLEDLQEYGDELDKLSTENFPKIPLVKIPNWPKGLVLNISLGPNSCFIPIITNGLLELKRIENLYILCFINDKGYITFQFRGKGPTIIIEDKRHIRRKYISSVHNDANITKSYHEDEICQYATLLIFRQLKYKIMNKAIREARRSMLAHNRTIEEIRRAFEPFVPFIIADELEK